MNQLTDEDFRRAATALDVDVAAIRAVAEVESNSEGFLPDGRPQILFEAHIFHRLTNGRHSGKVDRNGRLLSSQHWNRSLYGRAGDGQWERLADAAAHDSDAAHKASSWGMFQILGRNHAAVGHATITDFVAAMHTGAGAHLDAFITFLRSKNLDTALRQHDWVAFARGYNGPGFAANRFDVRLRNAFKKFTEEEKTA
jgi:hypothetical protein